MAENLDIVYRIAADISGLKDGVDKAAKATQGLETAASRMGTALAGAFTVTALVSFGKVLLADADALVKMSDRTGATIEGLQRLQAAGDDAGNTIEQMTGAINKLQNALVSGSEPAINALNKLGLSVEDIRAMKPDEAFIAISDAIRQIQDPAEQTRIAMELFGKSGAEILPTLKRGFDDLKDSAVGMSEETVSRLNEFGARIAKLTRTVKALAAEGLVRLVDAFDPMGAALERGAKESDKYEKKLREQVSAAQAAIAAARKQADALNGVIGPQMDASTEARIYADLLKRQEEEQRKAAEATKKAQDAIDKWNKSVEDATIKMNLSIFTLHRFGAIELPNVESSLKDVDTAIDHLDSRTLPNFRTNLGRTGQAGRNLQNELKPLAVDTLPALSQAFAELAQVSGPAFGGIARAAGQMITALNVAKIATDNLTLAQAAGAVSAGQYIQSMAGVVSAIYTIGKAIMDVLDQFTKGLFPEQRNLIDNLQEFIQFLELSGMSIEDLKKKAEAAGVTLKDLFDAKTPEEFKKRLDELNDALRFQDDAMKFLDDTVKKYGFTIEELGPKFAQQKLTEQAFQLQKEFKALQAAGIDVAVISEKMADSINEYLHAALKTGSAVPESMRPILQQLADMGLLTDENGEAITDLEAAGIKFSKSLDEQFEDLIKTINKLVEAIERGLGNAIANIPDPVVQGRVTWDVDPLPGGGIHNDFPPMGDPILGFAHGTGGEFVDFGEGTLAMLHGRERVMTEGEQASSDADSAPMGDLVMVVDGEAFGRIPLKQIAGRGRLMREFRTLVEQAST